MNVILDEILKNCDSTYCEFSKKLIPDTDNILGVRAPVLKQIAKKYANTDTGLGFLRSLPHKYHDEDMAHAYMLGFLKCSYEERKSLLMEFLPYVKNWAVADSLCMGLKDFFKDKEKSLDLVLSLTKSDMPYFVRVGLVCMLCYYVKKEYLPTLTKVCESIKSEHYYVKMALSWLISVMLVKEYESSLSLLDGRLNTWVHNKSIQKACESYRIDKERKQYLKTLKIRGVK